MKRAALLAVALAAVPLTASHAQAAEGRPQHDRDELIDFAREHGQTAAFPRDDLGRGLTQDGLFDACQVQNFSRSERWPERRRRQLQPGPRLRYRDLGSRPREHRRAFNADTFDYTLVFLDTDMNAGTGDLGDDYAVVAFFDDNDSSTWRSSGRRPRTRPPGR